MKSLIKNIPDLEHTIKILNRRIEELMKKKGDSLEDMQDLKRMRELLKKLKIENVNL